MKFEQNPTIAVIDSGIGGISILKQLIKKFSSGNYIYYADNLYMPYGNKSKSFIKKRVEGIIDTLFEQYGVSSVIVGCNTASTSIDTTKYKNLHVLTFDKDKVYLTTPLTKQNLGESRAIADKTLAKEVEKYIISDREHLNKVVKSHIKRYQLDKFSNLCLGCTHYELISDVFKRLLPNTEITNNSSKIIENINIKPTNETNVVFLMSRQSKEYHDKLHCLTFN